MADWYCSSAAYATYTAFQTSHVYTLGTIIVPTAPVAGKKIVLRCTTAGTSTTEPTWDASNNGTTTSGTATFTNITGQSAFFWTAAAGDLATLLGQITANRFAAGDRIFVSSDHSESQSFSPYHLGAGFGPTASFTSGQILSVNRAGSTPPVAADLLAGASVSTSNAITIDGYFPVYHYGVTYTSSSTIGIQINSAAFKTVYFDNSQLFLNSSNSSARIVSNGSGFLFLNNSTLKFGSTSQAVTGGQFGPLQIYWQNTTSAIAGATIPATLFISSQQQGPLLVTCRGVDLSAITGTMFGNSLSTAGQNGSKLLFDSCQIASGLTRSSTSNVANTGDLVELVNCYDGTSIISESYQPSGALTTETTITLNGGAADDVGSFSHKIVTNANVDKFVSPFASFWMDVENTTTGVSKTATVEIISSAALNNDEIALYLEYEGTAGSSVASFGSSFIATPLTTPAAVTTSTATWNSSPATPAQQKCQVTFTPQHAGRLRGQIRVGKASTTVYYNPQIAVT